MNISTISWLLGNVPLKINFIAYPGSDQSALDPV